MRVMLAESGLICNRYDKILIWVKCILNPLGTLSSRYGDPAFWRIGRFERSSCPCLFSLGSSVGLATRFPVSMAEASPLDLTDNPTGRLLFPFGIGFQWIFGDTRHVECHGVGWLSIFSRCLSSSTIMRAPSTMAAWTKTYCLKLWHRLILCSLISCTTSQMGSSKEPSSTGDLSSCNLRGSFRWAEGKPVGEGDDGGELDAGGNVERSLSQLIAFSSLSSADGDIDLDDDSPSSGRIH